MASTLLALLVATPSRAGELRYDPAQASIRIDEPGATLCSYPAASSPEQVCVDLVQRFARLGFKEVAIAVVPTAEVSATIIINGQHLERAGEATAERIANFMRGTRDGFGPDTVAYGFAGAEPYDVLHVNGVPAVRAVLFPSSGDIACVSYWFFRKDSFISVFTTGPKSQAKALQMLSERLASTLTMPNDASPDFGDPDTGEAASYRCGYLTGRIGIPVVLLAGVAWLVRRRGRPAPPSGLG